MGATSQTKELFEDYEGFVEKFKPKKTTDDCHTPPLVYEAVADWVAAEYGLNKANFVRPFYPGGDYEHYDYPADCVVVDNPPFSILIKIIDFYVTHGIRFFLFSPTLSGPVRYSDTCTVFPIGIVITYENGARVNTSFCTNLDPHEIRARTVPSLYAAVKAANDAAIKKIKKHLPKYRYPLELVTTAQLYPYARYGIEFVIPRAESVRVSRLDAQSKSQKVIFGCGWLLSERLTGEREKAEREKAEREKAEREKAERERAERFPLSEREREIVASLGKAGKA